MLPTVCLDLDGTLIRHWDGFYDVTKFGAPIEGAVEFTKELKKSANVLIYTCRGSEDLNDPYGAALLKKIIKEFLDEHGFEYDDIFVGQGKPVASWYIDDRAIPCAAERVSDPKAVYDSILGRIRTTL